MPSNMGDIACRACGAKQPATHVFCASCGARLAPKIVESNKRSFKRPAFPLFHPRLVVLDKRSGEPERRTWRDRLARLYFNLSLLALLVVIANRGGWVPEAIREPIAQRLATIAFRLPSLSDLVPQPKSSPSSTAAADAAAGTAGSDNGAASLAPQSATIAQSSGSSNPDKDVQILPYRLERVGNQLVAIGEVQNTGSTAVVNVVITFTFTGRGDQVIDVAKTDIGLIEPGQKMAWKVAVPYRSTVTSGGINVEWVSRPQRP